MKTLAPGGCGGGEHSLIPQGGHNQSWNDRTLGGNGEEMLGGISRVDYEGRFHTTLQQASRSSPGCGFLPPSSHPSHYSPSSFPPPHLPPSFLFLRKIVSMKTFLLLFPKNKTIQPTPSMEASILMKGQPQSVAFGKNNWEDVTGTLTFSPVQAFTFPIWPPSFESPSSNAKMLREHC